MEDSMDTGPEGPQSEGVKTPRQAPALVINIYSWLTPIVGVLMLVVGLLAGYFGRPWIASRLGMQTQASLTPAPASEVDVARRKELMDFLIGQVKHFKGDPNAPVTMIEFGDFQ
jgi:hypothetical protein